MREPVLGPGWKPFLILMAVATGLGYLLSTATSWLAWERSDDPLCLHTKPLCRPAAFLEYDQETGSFRAATEPSRDAPTVKWGFDPATGDLVPQ